MKILFGAEDPGGTNALMPVFRKLPHGHDARWFAAKHAVAILKKQGMPLVDCTDLGSAEIQKKLRAF